MTQPKIRDVKIEDITLDSSLQCRTKMDEEAIADYMANIDKLPPVTLFLEEGGEYLRIAAGWHRLEAHQRLGRKTIKAIIINGTYADAALVAAKSNNAHGVRLSIDDKWKTVSMMLACPEWAAKSDRWIADELEFGRELVGKVRKHLNERQLAGQASCQANPEEKPEFREGMDGRLRPTPPKPTGQALPMNPCRACRIRGLPTCQCVPSQVPVTRQKPGADIRADQSMKDGCDNEVPTNLRDVFADPWLKMMKQRFEEALAMIVSHGAAAALKNKTKHYVKWLPAVNALERLEECKDQLRLLIDTVELGIPFAVHQECKGKGCDACHKAGWFPLCAYQTMEAE